MKALPPSETYRGIRCEGLGSTMSQMVTRGHHRHPTGAAKSGSPSSGIFFTRRIVPPSSSALRASDKRISNFEAGSSAGSCSTSLPRTARLRMVWRRRLIWSGRDVRDGSASRANWVWLRNSSVEVSGAVMRSRLAAVSLSRVEENLTWSGVKLLNHE